MQRPPPLPRRVDVLVLEFSPGATATAVVREVLPPVLARPSGTRSRSTEGEPVVRSGSAGVSLEFEEFAVARGPALVRLARGLLKDPHAAEDVVQDVLAKALVKWGRISSADDPDAYVRRMVVNACTSFWRRAVRKEHPREHDLLPDRGVTDSAEGHAQRDQMIELLRRLPAKQRAVLVLRHYEGLPDAEIADLLGSSAVTVRSNAHRGLAALRAMLAEQGVSR